MTTTEITPTDTITLTPAQVGRTLANIEDFNRLAARKGLDARVALTIVTTHERLTGDDDWAGRPTYETVHEVRITGTTLVLPGDWHLAASLDLDEGGNVVRHNPHFTAAQLPDEFRTSDPRRCDHCHVKSRRKAALVLWSPTQGFVQVGRSCVRVFLGISPESLIAWYDEVGGVVDREGSARPEVDVERFVFTAAAATLIYGFRPMSVERGEPTRMVAEGAMLATAQWRKDHPEMAGAPAETLDAARALATAAIDWITTSTETGDYIVNLRTAAGRQFVGRNAGLLASLPNAYQRAMGAIAERAAREARPASTSLDGAVGGKVEFTGTVERFSVDDSDYGMRAFSQILTPAGQIVWYSTGARTDAAAALEEAHRTQEPVTVRATIKAFRSNRAGQPVTVVTRAKVGDEKPVRMSRKQKQAIVAAQYGDDELI